MKKLLLKFISYDTAEKIKTVLAWIYFLTGVSWLAGRFRRRGAAIFMFHSIGDDRSFSDNRLSAARFDTLVAYLAKNWEIVPLSRIVDAIEKGKDPSSRWVALTFDDGYADNARVALPILKKHGAVATFFPTVGVLEADGARPRRLFFDEIERIVMSAPGTGRFTLPGVAATVDLSTAAARTESARRVILEIRTQPPSKWDAVIDALSERLKPPAPAGRIYLDWNDVAEFERSGMEVGSHSLTHACLATLPRPAMVEELAESKRRLDAHLARPARGLAFPFGKKYAVPKDAGPELTAAGYRYALTTDFGRATSETPLFALPRLSVEDASLVRVKVELNGLRL